MSVLALLEVNVKPEYVNEFKSYMKEILPDTRVFNGCQSVELQVNQDNEVNLVLVEEWETREAQGKYMAWRAETGVVERIVSMISGPPSVRFFDKTDA
jgi:quinol monooxygenase YgiN